MKICISGAFSSGKTSMVQSIASIVPGSRIVKEYARSIKEAHPQIDWRDPVIRNHVLFAQIVLEAEAESENPDIVLCDSGVIDCMAHSVALGLPPHTYIAERYHTSRYDLVFCCDPTDVPLEDDGLRFTDRELRQRLDTAVQEICVEIGYEPIRLAGTIAVRTQLVLTELERRSENLGRIPRE